MTYLLRIGSLHVGPFTTHIAATTFAEQHGCDDYTMIQVQDPAEAPGILRKYRANNENQPLIPLKLQQDFIPADGSSPSDLPSSVVPAAS